MEKRLLKIRIFLWLILAIILTWLLFMAIAPSGKASYVYNFRNDSYFIGKLTPAERLEPIEDGEQKIIGDPVYFSLRMPRKFQTAKLTLKYKNIRAAPQTCGTAPTECTPIIEAGLLQDKIIWRYELKPIENKIVDQLALAWDVTLENGAMLLQRQKKYKNLDEFIKNPPPSEEIALYNYGLKIDYILPIYEPQNKENKINYALRGPYQFYTYVKDETLDFKFKFIDLNKNRDSDEINLNLYYKDNLIDSRQLSDNGEPIDDGKITNRGELKFNIANLPKGVYKIELRANDDVVTEEIVSKQSKVSFINKLWLADRGNIDIELVSDSRLISAQTINPAKLQTIKVGDQNLIIGETYKQFSIKADKDINIVKLEKDDIILSGNGVFSFGDGSFINPALDKVDDNISISGEGINYVLAKYQFPKEEGEWKVAQAEFDLGKAYTEFGEYTFLISIPGLEADNKGGDSVVLKEIRIDLEGKSLWKKLKGIRNQESGIRN